MLLLRKSPADGIDIETRPDLPFFSVEELGDGGVLDLVVVEDFWKEKRLFIGTLLGVALLVDARLVSDAPPL